MNPRPAQIEALRLLTDQKFFALLCAMRTGKSKMLLDDFGRLELEGKVSDLIIIAPGGVYRTWETAWRDHVSKDLQKRAAVHVWQSSKKDAAKPWLTHRGPRILLMNVEALSSVKAARALCEQIVKSRSTMLVVDESTCIKSHSAQRAKYVLALGAFAVYRRILSGLPTPRSPLDLFMQFSFLSTSILQHRSFYTFRARYAVVQNQLLNGRMVPIVVGYVNQDELRKKIAPFSYRVEFRPKIPSTYSIVDIELSKEQQKAYHEMLEYSTTMLAAEKHVTATIVITQLLKLHQILCGFVKDEQGKIHALPEKRTAKLIDLLNRGGGKTVIWCSYDYSIRHISHKLIEEFGEPAVARFWGGNVKDREKDEARFIKDPDCQFMLATPDAGGKGRTWSVADSVIYYSSTNDLEKRDQSEQRVQGVEKDRQVDYTDFIAPGTVEMNILKALRKKIDMASLITGANWREWLL
jgi:SNF2 family DNA or RNA helicase